MKKLRFTLFFATLLMLFTSCELEPQYVITNSNGEMIIVQSEVHQKSVCNHWKKDSTVRWVIFTIDGDTTQIWKRGQ